LLALAFGHIPSTAALGDAFALVHEGHQSIKSVIVGNEFIKSLDYVIWHSHPWWENRHADRQPLQSISRIDQLSPRYMWAENPKYATAPGAPMARHAPRAAIVGGPIDALGRAAEALSQRQRAVGAAEAAFLPR
jgi:hypothetical protein